MFFLSGQYDLGPLGCDLVDNLLRVWHQHFVLQEHMLKVGTQVMLPAWHQHFVLQEHVLKVGTQVMLPAWHQHFVLQEHVLNVSSQDLLCQNFT